MMMNIFSLLALVYLYGFHKCEAMSPLPTCKDNNAQQCPGWARAGECQKNPRYMLAECQMSCRVCQGPCAVARARALQIIQQGNYADGFVPSCNADGFYNEKQCSMAGCWCVTREGRDIPGTHQSPPRTPNCGFNYASTCKDDDKQCPGWARAGECQKNPRWMLVRCRMSCQVCQIPPPFDEEVEDASEEVGKDEDGSDVFIYNFTGSDGKKSHTG